MKQLLLLVVLVSLAISSGAFANEWPQHQAGPARLGRTAEVVSPPYRARWIWMGPQKIFRNSASNPTWPDDLNSRPGYSFPLGPTSPVTLAQTVQPVIGGGRVFLGTQQGSAFGISSSDGATLWETPLGSSVVATAAVDGNAVIFVTVAGRIAGLNTQNGAVLWQVNARKAITSAPCVVSGRVFVADHSGTVYCLNTQTGETVWTRKLPRPVQGGICADTNTVYIPAEDMYVYALQQSDGQVRASARVRGQSFRLTWPVVFNGRVWLQACMIPIMGSEYVMESLMADSNTLQEEQANIARFLNGDTNGGRWTDASPDWRHLFALQTSDLSQAFDIPCGPIGGVGFPPDPVVVDNQDRVLTWWKTRHPTLISPGAFGTNYSIDIAAVDQETGLRVPVGSGPPVPMLPGPETDNTYCFSVMGDWLWMRQTFRGTQMINLNTRAHNLALVHARGQDGGNFPANVCFVETIDLLPDTTDWALEGRTPPAVADGTVFIAEPFCLIALESQGGN